MARRGKRVEARRKKGGREAKRGARGCESEARRGVGEAKRGEERRGAEKANAIHLWRNEIGAPVEARAAISMRERRGQGVLPRGGRG